MYMERTTKGLNKEFVESWLMEHGYSYLFTVEGSVVYTKHYSCGDELEITDNVSVNNSSVLAVRRYDEAKANAYLAKLEDCERLEHFKGEDIYFNESTLDVLVLNSPNEVRKLTLK